MGTEDQLKKEIDDLEKLENKNQIIEKLQNINNFFLKNFYINIGNIAIHPIHIEAYFERFPVFCQFNENNRRIVHGTKEQLDYGKIHYHYNVANPETINNRNGLDLCLSRGKSFYSILIKKCKIQKDQSKVLTQSDLVYKIYEDGYKKLPQEFELKKYKNNKKIKKIARVGFKLEIGSEQEDNKLGASFNE